MSAREKPEAKVTSEQEKNELRVALTAFYGSVAPDLVKQGADILRRLGIREEIVSKLTDPESFANAALDDPKLTSNDIKQAAGLIQEVQDNPGRFFKPALRQWLKALPRIPGGGRTPVVPTLDEKREIIEFVHKLLLSVKPGIAKQRAAMRYGISRRTVDRIWKNREKIPPRS
jgi:hypothetical protein